jgi:hypothetical protein
MPKIFLVLIIGALLSTSAGAATKECLREMGKTFGNAQAKRICNSRNYVTRPNEYGWECVINDAEGVKLYKVKGRGAKQKRDAICE